MIRIRVAGVAAAVVLALGVAGARAQTTDWKIDNTHSEADFAIRHMAISTVHGSFRAVSGVIRFDAADVTKSSINATIDVASVDTGVAARDTHLKSPDFFEVAKYPSMTFKSTNVAKAEDGYAVTGNLTLHGVTRSVVLQLDAPGKEETGMDGKSLHRGFTAHTTLNRKDFGLNWNGTLKSGDAALGDEVRIELDIEAVKM
ncbi:protein yceI precursor [Granulicella sp. 5B5]|uniref:YceI family protein n=1 Tax=Granulicella sp. 5B5 TaxID=1617967 RepID=UPI0015F6AFC0|nr:YceI family protein [Granulicella sp. 5B5]QMV18401.1 protein yceI precursor [Granulicella sp. 5B5]